MNISVVIITKNEERRLGDVLKSVSEISTDIIVVDSGSTDDTLKIAQNHGAKCFILDWQGFSFMKNFGASKAQNDWVLSLDADEVLSDELIESLKTVTLNRGYIYALPLLNNYCGQWIKHSGWYPRDLIRLYHKLEHQWNGLKVHEGLTNLSSVNVIRLNGFLLHFTIYSKDQHKAKTEQYAKYRAEEWVNAHKSPSIFKRYFGYYARFFRNYIWKAGFLDGKAGLEIAKMEAWMITRQVYWFDVLRNQYLS